MKRIVVVPGSNSKNSINKILATYVANKIENSEVVVLDLNDFDLPLYGPDLETEKGIPEDVKKFNKFLESCDGLVISLSEYNGSYSTAFKNIFDWLSRLDREVWKNKPMILMATSPGKMGGALVLETAKKSFPHLGGNIIADFSLPSFGENFSEEGIKNKDLNDELNGKIELLNQALNK